MIPENLFNKYLKFKNLEKLKRNPNLRWCTRPGCENYVLLNSKNFFRKCRKLKCICGQEFCGTCREDWHQSKKCLRRVRSLNYRYTRVKACPQCNCHIEKFVGCNHMKYSFCRLEFCWICKKEYRFEL